MLINHSPKCSQMRGFRFFFHILLCNVKGLFFHTHNCNKFNTLCAVCTVCSILFARNQNKRQSHPRADKIASWLGSMIWFLLLCFVSQRKHHRIANSFRVWGGLRVNEETRTLYNEPFPRSNFAVLCATLHLGDWISHANKHAFLQSPAINIFTHSMHGHTV